MVEASLASGSLITARLAAEQGREVFAIPGSIHAPQSRGCHALIRQGAKLVESAQDVLEELRHHAMPQSSRTNTSAIEAGPGSRVLAIMGYDPVDLDTLAARCGLDISTLHTELLTLELDGHIETLPGGKLRRLATS